MSPEGVFSCHLWRPLLLWPDIASDPTCQAGSSKQSASSKFLGNTHSKEKPVISIFTRWGFMIVWVYSIHRIVRRGVCVSVWERERERCFFNDAVSYKGLCSIGGRWFAECVALLGSNIQGKTELLGEKSVPVLLR
jgi:hypothetical protein